MGKRDKVGGNDSVSMFSGILFSLETRLKVKQLAGLLYIGERISDLNDFLLSLFQHVLICIFVN